MRIICVCALALTTLLAGGCKTVTTPATTQQLQKTYLEEFGTVLTIREIAYNDSPDDGSGILGGVLAGALVGSDDGAAVEGALLGGLLGGISENFADKTAYEIRVRKDGGEVVTVLQRKRALRGLRARDRIRILTDSSGGTILEKTPSMPT